MRSVYAIDWNVDGLTDYTVSTINMYDRYGRLATTSIDEGWARRLTTNRYDRRGQLVEQEEEWDVEWDGLDGMVDFANRTLNVYDAHGNLLSTTATGEFYDYEDDWFDQRETWTINTYDRHKNILTTKSRTWWDWSIVTTTNSYDQRGNLRVRREDTDWDGDGGADHRVTTINAYDRRGNILVKGTEQDWDADVPWILSKRQQVHTRGMETCSPKCSNPIGTGTALQILAAPRVHVRRTREHAGASD